MNARFLVLLATGLLFAAGRASAEPQFSTFELNFTQAGTSNSLSVSMIFRAVSPTRYLALGGGFTVRCNQTTAGQIHAKNLAQRLGFGVPLQVNVPANSLGYSVPGYSSIPTASCASCNITWVARAIDSFFEQAAAISGDGAFFTLSPWQENILVETNEQSSIP